MIKASIILDRRTVIRVPLFDIDSTLFEPFNLICDSGSPVSNEGPQLVFVRSSPLRKIFQDVEVRYSSLPWIIAIFLRGRAKPVEAFVATKKELISREVYKALPKEDIFDSEDL